VVTSPANGGTALAPISGATLSILDGPNAGKSATTDLSGNYAFTELQPSAFKVKVSALNYFPSENTPITLTSNQTKTFSLIWLGATIVLTGQATDITTSAPIPRATVNVNGRYFTTADASGNYSLTGYLDQGAGSVVYVQANGYELYGRYIRGISSQNFRLHRLERIEAGDSWSVTMTPEDSLCSNDLQEPQFGVPDSDYSYVCRTVRVVAPSDGVMTVEAFSVPDGARPPLEVEAFSERMGNPMSIQVWGGIEVKVSVELPESSATSKSFTLKTSMAGQ
jgi:hypothetical protein